MGLMFIPIMSIAGMALVVVFFVMFMGLAFVVGLGSAAGLPTWLGAILSGILILGSVLLFVALVLLVAARVVFVPNALMIEGRSAGGAFGRAFQLGGGRTWYRLGMIGAFSYFVNIATFFALVEPLLGIFWMNGWAVQDLLFHPGWNAAYAAVNQISTLLVWPIWITSLTLLYFDTRVRKEGYDIELMTAGLKQPAYSYAGPMAAFRPPTVQWGGPPMTPPRPYMQTGPLGLGGYPYTAPRPAGPIRPPGSTLDPGASPSIGVRESGPIDFSRAHPSPVPGGAAGDAAEGAAPRPQPGPKIEASPGFYPADPSLRPAEAGTANSGPAGYPGPGQTVTGASQPTPVRCSVCGLVAIPGAKYCIACGDLLQTGGSTPS
jgi:hypothetical protein